MNEQCRFYNKQRRGKNVIIFHEVHIAIISIQLPHGWLCATENEQGDTLLYCSPQQDTILAEYPQWLPVAIRVHVD